MPGRLCAAVGGAAHERNRAQLAHARRRLWRPPVHGRTRQVAATAGIVQHLCRFAVESSPALLGQQAGQLPPVLDPLTGAAATEARRAAVRGFVVPMLIGMASTSSSTRAKLWACNGIDIFLQLLGEEVRRGGGGGRAPWGGRALARGLRCRPKRRLLRQPLVQLRRTPKWGGVLTPTHRQLLPRATLETLTLETLTLETLTLETLTLETLILETLTLETLTLETLTLETLAPS